MGRNKKDAGRIKTTISEGQAERLCATGEWITDDDVKKRINEKSKEIQCGFVDWPPSPMRPDILVLKEFFQIAPELLGEKVESKIVHHRFEPHAHAEVRVKPGAVFKVKSAALLAGEKALALVLVIFATTTWPLLFPAWAGLSIINLVRIILNSYESLLDPDELSVFEAIFRCQGRSCIVNYDALKEMRYNDAYATANPTVAEIEREIHGRVESQAILKALSSLKSRGVLKERDGVWSIAF